MKWFGVPWGAPVNDFAESTETPVGGRCIHCSLLIKEGDRGLVMPYVGQKHVAECYYHLDCFLEEVLGPADSPMRLKHHDHA